MPTMCTLGHRVSQRAPSTPRVPSSPRRRSADVRATAIGATGRPSTSRTWSPGPNTGRCGSGVAGLRTGPRSDPDAVLGQPRRRVDGAAAVRVDLQVQVRAGGVTGVADLADLLARGDLLAHRDADLGHVAVPADRAVPVPD